MFVTSKIYIIQDHKRNKSIQDRLEVFSVFFLVLFSFTGGQSKLREKE